MNKIAIENVKTHLMVMASDAKKMSDRIEKENMDPAYIQMWKDQEAIYIMLLKTMDDIK